MTKSADEAGGMSALLRDDGKTGTDRDWQRNTNMKKALIAALIILFATGFSIAVFSFFTGSLEMFPTTEQEGKIMIVAACIAVVCAVIDAILLICLKRIMKRN